MSIQRRAEVRMIPVDRWNECLLMTLIVQPHNAFFDEAGTHDQSDLVVVGGLLADYQAWANAELEWLKVLKHAGVSIPFHFTDFMARQPPWDWPDSKRDDFMERLTTIIGDTIALGLSMGIFRTDYTIIPEGLRADFKDIYHCRTYFCLDALVKWKANFSGAPLPTPIEFLFDRKPKFEGYAASIYYQVAKRIRQESNAGRHGIWFQREGCSAPNGRPVCWCVSPTFSAAKKGRSQRSLRSGNGADEQERSAHGFRSPHGGAKASDGESLRD
jgi:hypothetical protein